MTILGRPFAIFLFYQEKIKKRRDREFGTHNVNDGKYIHFLEMCQERPDLDVLDIPLESNIHGTKFLQKRQEQILFTILISIFERAYLMYSDRITEIKNRQWMG